MLQHTPTLSSQESGMRRSWSFTGSEQLIGVPWSMLLMIKLLLSVTSPSFKIGLWKRVLLWQILSPLKWEGTQWSEGISVGMMHTNTNIKMTNVLWIFSAFMFSVYRKVRCTIKTRTWWTVIYDTWESMEKQETLDVSSHGGWKIYKTKRNVTIKMKFRSLCPHICLLFKYQRLHADYEWLIEGCTW